MRSVSCLLLAIGLVISYSSARAQDAPPPKVQVIIGPDGSVKVVDAKSGKELPSTVIKVADRARNVEDVQKAEAQKHLEQARQQLEKLLREKEKTPKAEKAEKPRQPDVRDIEIELQFTPDIVVEKKGKKVAQPATSVDQKLDLLLRQMEELRRDVNQLKNKLEGKQPDVRMLRIISGDGKETDKKPDAPRIQIVPMPGGPPVNKIDPDTLKQLQELFKKLEAEQPDQRKKSPTDPYLRLPPAPVDRSTDLEQRLERALRDIEELRREIQKSKSAK